MKLLFIMSDKISTSDIVWGLLELKEEVEIYDKSITLQSYKQEEQRELTEYLQQKRYDGVIMNNFSPIVSNACEASGVKYISWIFDSPQIDLFTKEFYNNCNYFFVFDKTECERLSVRNPKHLYHMPLAGNVTRAELMKITKEEREKFSSEISFVGGLYEANVWNSVSDKLPADIREKMESWMEQKLFCWEKGEPFFGCLSKEDVDRLCKQIYMGEWVDLDKGYYLENHFLARKAAEIERVCILNLLAEQYPVDLYTGSDTSVLQNVNCHPPVDYSEEVPKIYQLSKINLNITLRSIETGIPQRIFDIMSVGGFVISNYQEELEEFFVPDKEIVLFKTPEELLEKIDYYRHHEAERRQIAQNGYKKVCQCYSYPVLLKKILSIVKNEDK